MKAIRLNDGRALLYFAAKNGVAYYILSHGASFDRVNAEISEVREVPFYVDVTYSSCLEAWTAVAYKDGVTVAYVDRDPIEAIDRLNDKMEAFLAALAAKNEQQQQNASQTEETKKRGRAAKKSEQIEQKSQPAPVAQTEPVVEVKPAQTEPVVEVKPAQMEPVAEVKPAQAEPVAEVKPAQTESNETKNNMPTVVKRLTYLRTQPRTPEVDDVRKMLLQRLQDVGIDNAQLRLLCAGAVDRLNQLLEKHAPHAEYYSDGHIRLIEENVANFIRDVQDSLKSS